MPAFTLHGWVGSCRLIHFLGTSRIHSPCIATHMQPMIQSALQIIPGWYWMIATRTLAADLLGTGPSSSEVGTSSAAVVAFLSPELGTTWAATRAIVHQAA